jgi:hypothetical protein
LEDGSGWRSRVALGSGLARLAILGRDPDPAKSREHVLLSVLAENRLRNGQLSDLGVLLKTALTRPSSRSAKRPIVSLMKQARAFGVGVVIATQNPMDLDYRALDNAGLWCVGRLQTDADRSVGDDAGARHVSTRTTSSCGLRRPPSARWTPS